MSQSADTNFSVKSVAALHLHYIGLVLLENPTYTIKSYSYFTPDLE